MKLEQADLDYFDRGKKDNPKYWSRLGGEPDFKGLKILDVGCGHGSLCVDIASKGAKNVLGIDIDKRIIEFAKANVVQNHPHVKDNLEFKSIDVRSLDDKNFDIIISKNSFEHIIELEDVFGAMKKRLKPGGRLYVGFSPLYNSPIGDHRLLGTKVPWGHILFSEQKLIDKYNKGREQKDRIESVYDLGMNKRSLAEFKALYDSSGLKITYYRVNVSKNPLAKIFSLVKRIPALEEYFTYNMYCILDKKS
jgi:SAM-dependent methyltransferase